MPPCQHIGRQLLFGKRHMILARLIAHRNRFTVHWSGDLARRAARTGTKRRPQAGNEMNAASSSQEEKKTWHVNLHEHRSINHAGGSRLDV